MRRLVCILVCLAFLSQEFPAYAMDGVLSLPVAFSLGRVAQKTDALSHSVTYAYDAAGNRLEKTEQKDGAADAVSVYAYDARH